MLTSRKPIRRSPLKPLKRSPIVRKKRARRGNRIDYSLLARPKVPKAQKPSILIRADGREVCNLRTPGGFDEYRRRIGLMTERQGNRCSIGGEPMSFLFATFEHGAGRNKNRRDDRIDIVGVDGFYVNSSACMVHNCAKGSRRDYPLAIRLKPEAQQ